MTGITINEQKTTASSTGDVRELWDLAGKKHLVGGRPTPLKNISQLGLLFPYIMGKKNPNHQPDMFKYQNYKVSTTFWAVRLGVLKEEASSDPHHDILFWHSFWHTIWKYIIDDILSDILSGIYSDIPEDLLAFYLALGLDEALVMGNPLESWTAKFRWDHITLKCYRDPQGTSTYISMFYD